MGAVAKKNTTNSSLPKQIGRFEPIDILGKGAQGVVYLAEDTQLGRKVAIKTLDKHRQDAEQLNQEAKHVSQLNNPHIIPLYEIGFQEETPFLVYQFYEGEQLKQRLQREGKLNQLDAVKITDQLLDGVGYAHKNNIIHRDLNPSNLLIDKAGNIRIMDFGISVIVGTVTASTEVTGTVNYLAPEQLTNSELGPPVDIFASGLILYEMLTGHQVYAANNSMAVMYKITNEIVPPPSKRNPEIDKDLDAVVMKALEKDPSDRYASAAEMQTALKKYLKVDDEVIESSAANVATAVDFLLRRMKRKKDFPAVSGHITEINQKSSSSNTSSANELSNVILKDFALTTKVVRLVNSSFYGQFGGEITTVSRAVVILGYEHVRAAVLSIILFEHLQNNEQANELKNAAYTALMSGIISREKAKQMKNINDDDVETAFVTSMFHLLGKLLSIYYFPEEFEAMKTLVMNKGVDEDQAMRSVLGVSYEELGRGIAKEWNLPDVIGDSMQRLPEGTVPVAKTSKESLRQLACFSNELCAITSNDQDSEQAYADLATRYKDSLGITKESIDKLLESSIKEAEEFTRILNIDTSKVTVFNNIRKNTEEKEEGENWTTEVNDNKSSGDNGVTIETVKAEPKTQQQNQHDILVNGIAEITDSLLGDSNLNDILTMVLETIYRGMGFNRVLFAIHIPKNKQVLARFGLGKGIDEIIPNFRYKTDDSNDVFVSTVKTGKEYIILDVNSDEYKDKIPAWVRKLTMPTTVVLYPLIVNKRCLGLIYADNDDSNTKISMEALGFFKTLRNQASLAIQQIKK
jgi:eukaryotic-like serine/threonine-protein kinase